MTALCANEPDLWFSADPASIEYAQHVCQACPLRAACEQFAIDNRIEHGVWGGRLFAPIQVQRPTVPEYAAINAARRDRWNQGWTDEQIGAAEGIATSAIRKWRRRNGLAARGMAA